jgi:peptidylprolyl isomerase
MNKGKRMKKLLLVLPFICIMIAFGCSDTEDLSNPVMDTPDKTAQKPQKEEKPAEPEEVKKEEKQSVPEEKKEEPKKTDKPEEVEVAVIETKFGKIVIEFNTDNAPKTVKRMKELITLGFYDGLSFWRIERGFCIQGGANEMGGTGQNIPDEFTSEPFVEGSVGMANTGAPNSSDCQFFITMCRTSDLDKKYNLFARVIEGMSVVHEIEKVPVELRGRIHAAKKPILITSFRLEKRKPAK